MTYSSYHQLINFISLLTKIKNLTNVKDLEVIITMDLREFLQSHQITAMTQAIYDGKKFQSNQRGYLRKNHPLTLDTKIPIGSLMEIMISSFIVTKLPQWGYELTDSLLKLYPHLDIKEEQFSIRFLELSHLLSHSSGLANIRSRRDLFRGSQIEKVETESELIPLRAYFQHQITQLQSPGAVIVKNPMDYGLVAWIVEYITKVSFQDQIQEFLRSHGVTDAPYHYDFELGRKQKRYSRKSRPITQRHFYHLYPSTMGSMTIRNLLTVIHSLLFTSPDSERIRRAQFKSVHQPTPYSDLVCIPLRHRADFDCYQYSSRIHGFTVVMVIHPNEEKIGVSVVNKEGPGSVYLAGKILRKFYRDRTFDLLPDYSVDSLTLTSDQIEAITENFVSYKPSTLSYRFNPDLGGGITIKSRKDRLYMTNLPDGIFAKSTQVSYRHHLIPLHQDGDRLVLGYDDGIYFSKVVIPSSSKAPILYAEIDTGATLYFKSFHSIIWVNLRQTWNYLLLSFMISVLHGVIRDRFGFTFEPIATSRPIHPDKRGEQPDPREKPTYIHDRLPGPEISVQAIFSGIVGMFISLPTFISPFYRRFRSDLAIVINFISSRIRQGTEWIGKPPTPVVYGLQNHFRYRFKQIQTQLYELIKGPLLDQIKTWYRSISSDR